MFRLGIDQAWFSSISRSNWSFDEWSHATISRLYKESLIYTTEKGEPNCLIQKEGKVRYQKFTGPAIATFQRGIRSSRVKLDTF